MMNMLTILCALAALSVAWVGANEEAASSAAASAASDGASEYIDPVVHRRAGLLTREECAQLLSVIKEARYLEMRNTVDTLYIYQKSWTAPNKRDPVGFKGHRGRVDDEPVWNALQPFMPKFDQLMKESRDQDAFDEVMPARFRGREPVLNWVQVKRYNSIVRTTGMNLLDTHTDVNMNTITVALNDDYEGGGFYYVKPPVDQSGYNATGPTGKDAFPKIPEKYTKNDWIKEAERKNTTDIIFPTMQTGDALVYNYTIWHGVAPVKFGIRYALQLLYDHDNPAVEPRYANDDSSGDYADDDDSYDEPEGEVVEIEVHHKLRGVKIDLLLVYDAWEEEEKEELIYDRITHRDIITYHAFEGDELRAYVSGTKDVAADFTVTKEQNNYMIQKNGVVSDGGGSGYLSGLAWNVTQSTIAMMNATMYQMYYMVFGDETATQPSGNEAEAGEQKEEL